MHTTGFGARVARQRCPRLRGAKLYPPSWYNRSTSPDATGQAPRRYPSSDKRMPGATPVTDSRARTLMHPFGGNACQRSGGQTKTGGSIVLSVDERSAGTGPRPGQAGCRKGCLERQTSGRSLASRGHRCAASGLSSLQGRPADCGHVPVERPLCGRGSSSYSPLRRSISSCPLAGAFTRSSRE